MKGRIKEHGAPVYDSPAARSDDKVLFFAPGTTVEVLEGYYGDFYAVKVHGRGEPAYIRRVHVDIQPDSDVQSEGAPRKGGPRLPGAIGRFLYGLLIGLLGFILACSGLAMVLDNWVQGSDVTAAEDVAFYVLFFGGLFLLFGGPIFFWWLLPFWRLSVRHEGEDKPSMISVVVGIALSILLIWALFKILD